MHKNLLSQRAIEENNTLNEYIVDDADYVMDQCLPHADVVWFERVVGD